MAAGVFTFVSILLYIHRSTGQSYCGDDQFICWSDLTCLNLSYKCDGDVDCSDGSDEAGCGDTLRECHCKIQPECKFSASCDVFGCQDGWQGYKCAFKIRDKIVTTFSPTSTQSQFDTSYDCHCVDQSECNDRFYGSSCYCQEGWKGIRCSEKVAYITNESLGLIGGVIIVLLVISVVGLLAFCVNRLKRRRGLRGHGLPFGRLTNSQESIERSSVSAIPPHLSTAPPAYEDVVSQGTGHNPGQLLTHMPDRNQMEPPPDRGQDAAPPSYESIIKNQRNQEIQIHRQPVPENTTNETREPVQELTTSETREPGCESLVIVQIQNESTSDRDTHDMPDIGSDQDMIIPI